MAEKILDVAGLSCPLPVLKARKALREMAPGQTLEVLATDPAALDDFPDFCRTAGHELLDSSTIKGDIYRFVIKRGE
jgi:tRNA 2-thiouridine synthesizing protein A